MADLIEIQKEIDKADLRKSIEIADRSKINKFLTQQPELFAPEILKLVAYYFFDPDRKPLKVGPKPKKKRSFLGIDQIARMYYYLMKHKEVAWCILNRDKEAFELVEGSSLFDEDGNFAPQWKYPHATRKRENTPLPDGDDITEIVCKSFGICKRELDDIKARYNRTRK